ncbi:testis-specific gene 10 protein isoform X1 [Alosa sapidissima]|uniref:testis-specific gene 10 protein isoform X1 n=2 Tax=Alosa sapidissima TaxID=34773 RepID=UPI001C093E2E|nr:testis-specific gene 10 protein isoform X1 [Alosa sapidissima]XP_041935875.1 testis-specific gene 10 protein isoform X1 [Alosa sapidissima]
MWRSRPSTSPTRGLALSPSPPRHSPVKGGTYDSELMRVLRERDEMQAVLEKYERHLSEIQANVKVLTADRDKTSMHYQQAQQEIAALRREVMRARSVRSSSGSKGGVTAHSILKRVETERDEAQSDLQRMTTERDSLRERLKITQETAISERAHLEQRVEDLQTAVLTLEQERGEQRSRQLLLKEAMRELEQEVQGLSSKLSGAEEELSGYRDQCSVLRLSQNQTESNLNETQRRLTSRIGELQKVQEKNKQLDEKNESLLRQLHAMREEMGSVQSSKSDLQQRTLSLQEQLDKKSLQLSMANSQLDDNERTIRGLKITVEELETTIRGLRDSVSVRDCELGLVRKKLSDSEDELGATLKARDATAREVSQLRDDLDKARIDNQALQLKVDDCSQEMDNLQRRVQDYAEDISRIEDLLASKEHECRELQEGRRRASLQAESWESQARQAETVASQLRMELVTADLERQRLKEKLANLEASLQEAVSAERGCCGQLSQLNRRLLQLEEELRETQRQQSTTHTDLEKTRQLCVKLDISKEALQRDLDASQSELSSLRKQLSSERTSTRTLEAVLSTTRDKDLQRQLSSEERSVEVQLLRDKLTKADTKASVLHTAHTQLYTKGSCQSREVAHLRTRASQLESDLEMTKKQLATERFDRERAVQELRRQGLSSTLSSTLSSSLRPSSPSRRSVSPQRPWSPERPYHSTPEHRSPKRNAILRDLYD